MEVLDIIEHEDGSATYQFDMTAEENEAMCRNGILWAIVCGCTGLTIDRAMKDYSTKEETPMYNTPFNFDTIGLEKFTDAIRITSYIIQDTGLIMSGTRADGGVVGFRKEGDFDNDYIAYNLDHDVLFIHPDNLTGKQLRSVYGIAFLFDLTVEEKYGDD